MDVRLCASYVILLCYCCSGLDGTPDSCTNATMSCMGGDDHPGTPCQVSTSWLTCIDGTRDVCQLVETHVTFPRLAAVYSTICNELMPQLESALQCEALSTCTSESEYAKAFNITDRERREERIAHEIVTTDFWCRYWVENLDCYVSTAKACSQTHDDVQNVTEHLGKFKATCKMTSGTATAGSTLAVHTLAAFVLLWIYH